MTWELIQAIPTECIIDNSGIYTVINRVAGEKPFKDYTGNCISVRIDVMTDEDIPLISFEGKAEDVRKSVIRWLENHINRLNFTNMSIEHASYIGAELERAFVDTKYVQR